MGPSSGASTNSGSFSRRAGNWAATNWRAEQALGKLFADTRNLGYTTRNILVAGPRSYFNKAGLIRHRPSYTDKPVLNYLTFRGMMLLKPN